MVFAESGHQYEIDFIVSRLGSTGQPCTYDPSLSVIFIPWPSDKYFVISNSNEEAVNLYDTAGGGNVINSASMAVLEGGTFLVFASGNVSKSFNPNPPVGDGYSAMAQIVIDDTWMNASYPSPVFLYDPDNAPGGDRDASYATSRAFERGGPSLHTFNHVGLQSDSSDPDYGRSIVTGSNLSVLFVPFTDPFSTINFVGYSHWNTNSGTSEVIGSLEILMPHSGWVFISANGSVRRVDGPFEAEFRIGIDNQWGDLGTRRFVNIYDKADFSSDERPFSVSLLKELGQGNHTIYLTGARFSGSGMVSVRGSELMVLAYYYPKIYLPLILR
jgi:hypothetical protein